ncbi:hypothetical protein CEP49_06090 [Mergibacter septicus]|uniref:phage tail fiber protein n=1 Tax=Mergibacter septicus TaxID=221402 RepID=UPI0011794CE7|nr:phage protein [Mergibacter septicus]AWX14148.1 hypothetical protein CEP49_06090 [Mergibacter septicus]
MAIFDPTQVSVLINGVQITDWADGSDVISVTRNEDVGAWTMGANGTGVFVSNPNKSGKLTLKVKQHSPDNKFLNKLLNGQQNNISSQNSISLAIRDLLNEDVVTGENGRFTTPPAYTRGNGHNPTTWTIEFEKIEIDLENGA